MPASAPERNAVTSTRVGASTRSKIPAPIATCAGACVSVGKTASRSTPGVPWARDWGLAQPAATTATASSATSLARLTAT